MSGGRMLGACWSRPNGHVPLLLENFFTLYHLETDRAWFLERHYIVDNKARSSDNKARPSARR